MDARLAVLLTAYHDTIEEALLLLDQAGIPHPDSNTAWAINAIPPVGHSYHRAPAPA